MFDALGLLRRLFQPADSRARHGERSAEYNAAMKPSPTPCGPVGKRCVRGSTGPALLTIAVVQLFAHAQISPNAQAAGTATAQSVVTVGAQQLLDIDSGQIWSQPYLRIVGGVIEEVRQRQAGEPVTYDLGAVTLLPGLIDCHTHLVGGAGLGPYADLTQTPARAAIEGVANAWLTLQAGFTTVRDLGSRDLADVALRDAIASGRILGPRMLVAVRSLSTTGGHGDWNDLPPDVHVQRETAAIADGVEGVQRAVRQNMKYGADWIKILVTGGVTSAGTSPLQADYTLEEVQAAVTTARARGLDVAAHAHGEEGILRATRAGVRSIEHASFISDAAITELRRTGAFIVSNPYTNYYILEQGKNGGYQDYEIEKSRQVYQAKLGSLRRAIRAGIPVAYGTDSGVQPHGTNARQLSIYVEAGMTPLGALQSATLVAARLLRREQTLGRLRRGYVGDLVAVRENPLQNIRTLETPQHVMKDGVLVWSRPPQSSGVTFDNRAPTTAQSPIRASAASAQPTVSPSSPRPAAPRPPRPATRPGLPAGGPEESVWR
jgi:imidazolonepropionase-like amidohydrolase